MGFEERLNEAIQRGKHRSTAKQAAAEAKAYSEDELKRLHNQYRLQLSERIEQCLEKLPHHFPGFTFETIFGERGWGAACRRDDLRLSRGGKRDTDYSRLEMTIRPISPYHVVELVGKGTVRNKEIFNRTYFEKIEEADIEKFSELIDLWVLEYAELYSAKA